MKKKIYLLCASTILPASLPPVKQNKNKNIFFMGKTDAAETGEESVCDTLTFWLIGKQLGSGEVFLGNNNPIISIWAGQVGLLLKSLLGDHHSLKLSFIYLCHCLWLILTCRIQTIDCDCLKYCSVPGTKNNAHGSFQWIFVEWFC